MKHLLYSTLILILFNLLQAGEYIPSDVQRIINIRETEIQKIDEQYCAALEKKKRKYTQSGDLVHALLIDELIKEVRETSSAQRDERLILDDIIGNWKPGHDESKIRSLKPNYTFEVNGKIAGTWKISNGYLFCYFKSHTHSYKLPPKDGLLVGKSTSGSGTSLTKIEK